MQPVSAAQLISPAIQRTRRLLFQPFAWKTFLKLSVVAILTEGFSGNFNFSTGSHSNASAGSPFPSFPTLTPAWIALLVALGLLLIVVAIAISYLITRLRFALFHCLVHGTTEIKPGWRLYHSQAGRFFWFCIVVGVVFLAITLVITIPFVFGFIHLFQTSQGQQFDVPAFLAVFLPLIPVIFLLVIAGVSISIILRDLMLPHFALDDASGGAAWRAVRGAISREKGAFLLYAFLRVLLPAVVLLGVMMVVGIPTFILAVVVIVAKVGLIFEIVLGLLVLALWLALAIGIGGPLGIAVRNYALLFYGGRYAKLGDLLSPPPPVLL